MPFADSPPPGGPRFSYPPLTGAAKTVEEALLRRLETPPLDFDALDRIAASESLEVRKLVQVAVHGMLKLDSSHSWYSYLATRQHRAASSVLKRGRRQLAALQQKIAVTPAKIETLVGNPLWMSRQGQRCILLASGAAALITIDLYMLSNVAFESQVPYLDTWHEAIAASTPFTFGAWLLLRRLLRAAEGKAGARLHARLIWGGAFYGLGAVLLYVYSLGNAHSGSDPLGAVEPAIGAPALAMLACGVLILTATELDRMATDAYTSMFRVKWVENPKYASLVGTATALRRALAKAADKKASATELMKRVAAVSKLAVCEGLAYATERGCVYQERRKRLLAQKTTAAEIARLTALAAKAKSQLNAVLNALKDATTRRDNHRDA